MNSRNQQYFLIVFSLILVSFFVAFAATTIWQLNKDQTMYQKGYDLGFAEGKNPDSVKNKVLLDY